jgi:TRAP-type mannitol/chloroaromatic compound transport system permease large subunit
MAVTVPFDPVGPSSASAHAPISKSAGLPDIAAAPAEESYIHFLARECRVLLRWVVMFLAVVTAVTFSTLFAWALLPAFLLLGAYMLYRVADRVEVRTRHAGDPTGDTTLVVETEHEDDPITVSEFERREISQAVQGRVTRIVLVVALAVMVLAVVVAGMVFGGELMLLGTLILFAYMLLVAAPMWLGWVEDDAETVTHQVEDRLHAPTT